MKAEFQMIVYEREKSNNGIILFEAKKKKVHLRARLSQLTLALYSEWNDVGQLEIMDLIISIKIIFLFV